MYNYFHLVIILYFSPQFSSYVYRPSFYLKLRFSSFRFNSSKVKAQKCRNNDFLHEGKTEAFVAIERLGLEKLFYVIFSFFVQYGTFYDTEHFVKPSILAYVLCNVIKMPVCYSGLDTIDEISHRLSVKYQPKLLFGCYYDHIFNDIYGSTTLYTRMYS